MGCRWYFYNATLDQYYSTGSDSLSSVQNDLKKIFEYYRWSFEHTIHIVNDCEVEINHSRVIG